MATYVDVSALALEATLQSVLTELTQKTEPADTQTISGTVTANAGTNLNTSALALEASLQAVLTELTAKTEPANTQIIGDAGAIINLDASGDVQVDILSGTVTANAGTDLNTSLLALETGGNLAAAAASLGILDDWDNAASDGASVSGDVAHDSPDAGEPVKVGYKAINHGTNPASVGANDRTDGYANRAGIPWVIGGHPNIVTLRANYTTSQSSTAIISGTASTRIVVTRCTATVDNACSADVQVRIGFAASVTPTTTGVVLSHPGIAAGSGVVEGNGAGILGVGAAADALLITSEEPTGGSLDVVVSYYTINEA